MTAVLDFRPVQLLRMGLITIIIVIYSNRLHVLA